MSRPVSFRTVRWIRTLNLIAQAVLFVTLFAGLNYLASQYTWRFDLTSTRRYSLSPETVSYIEGLKQPVRVIVTLTDDSDIDQVVQAHRDVMGLLREFTYASEKNRGGRITAEVLDVFQRRNDAEKLGVEANKVLVLCGDRRHLIDATDLYQVEKQEKKAFIGEQVLTRAILDVSSSEKRKIYFLTGHGEMQLDDASPARGLSSVYNDLRMRNYDVEPLDLAQKRAIPADATTIVIAGPQGRLDPSEVELLRQFLTTRAEPGRIIALIPPAVKHGLDELFFDWGVLLDDDVIYDQSAQGRNETGDLIVYPAETTPPHPVTAYLFNYRIAVRFGPTRSVRVDPGRTLDNNLVVTPLVGASAEAWGERDYRAPGTPVFNQGVDLPPRLPVVLASERVNNRGGLPFTIPGGRLVTIGSADWIANGRYNAIGNQPLFLSAINWTADRDIELKALPRAIEQYQLSLNSQQLQRLRYSLLFALPGAAALLGLIVYWTRRS